MERRLLLEKLMVSMPQLATPTISLSNDTLSIEEVENAEYYDIYVDGVLEESVPVVEPTPTLISFTIDNVSYQAEPGMTWAQWIVSEYNTNYFMIDQDDYVIRLEQASPSPVPGPPTTYYVTIGSRPVSSTDTIDATIQYEIRSGGVID